MTPSQRNFSWEGFSWATTEARTTGISWPMGTDLGIGEMEGSSWAPGNLWYLDGTSRGRVFRPVQAPGLVNFPAGEQTTVWWF